MDSKMMRAQESEKKTAGKQVRWMEIKENCCKWLTTNPWGTQIGRKPKRTISPNTTARAISCLLERRRERENKCCWDKMIRAQGKWWNGHTNIVTEQPALTRSRAALIPDIPGIQNGYHKTHIDSAISDMWDQINDELHRIIRRQLKYLLQSQWHLACS
jgi:hypothetical protein